MHSITHGVQGWVVVISHVRTLLLGEEYGPWFLFSLFAAILVWEEVWDLPHTAALSGWLLLLITAGAVVCGAIFERRYWCR